MDTEIVFNFLLCQTELTEHSCAYVCTYVYKLNS